ncbi:MAG TPA: helix-turn-helix transcriptional regulator [Vicingus sp.]|nr:helix-turn-helix transcriptional regulator [Vicingus sp.]HRP59786.1 helix-turn-helix transcriptional regulator [Vicingus sp.]
MKTNSEILKKIKQARLIKEISQEQMAKKLMISSPTYSRFERGISKINIDLLQKISTILDVEFVLNPPSETLKNMVQEDNEPYLSIKDTNGLEEKIEAVVRLLEKQQKVNTMLLNHLKDMLKNK